MAYTVEGLFGIQIDYGTEYFGPLNIFEDDCTLSILAC